MLSATVTPGYTFTTGELITEDKLNAAANPAVDIEGTVSAAALADGSITEPKYGTGTVSARALAADAVTAAAMAPGAACAATVQPDAYFYGAATVGAIGGGVYPIAFAANGVNTSPVPGNYVAGQTYCFLPNFNCPGPCTVNINGIGAAALVKNVSQALGAGDFLSGQLVWIQFDGTNFQITTPPAVTGGGNQGLAINAPGGGQTVSISAAQLILSNAAGGTFRLTGVNLAGISLAAAGAGGLDTGAVAANKWYYVYAIWNGATLAGLLSLSATAPTLPAGYFATGLLGAAATDRNSNALAFSQIGRRVYLPPSLLFTAYAASGAAAYQVLTLTNLNAATVTEIWTTRASTVQILTTGSTLSSLLALYIPPTAVSVSGIAGSISGNNAGIGVASGNSGVGEQIVAGSPGQALEGFGCAGAFTVPITDHTYFLAWMGADTTARNRVMITGFEI